MCLVEKSVLTECQVLELFHKCWMYGWSIVMAHWVDIWYLSWFCGRFILQCNGPWLVCDLNFIGFAVWEIVTLNKNH